MKRMNTVSLSVPHAKYTNGTYYGIPYHNQYPIATAYDSRRPERHSYYICCYDGGETVRSLMDGKVEGNEDKLSAFARLKLFTTTSMLPKLIRFRTLRPSYTTSPSFWKDLGMKINFQLLRATLLLCIRQVSFIWTILPVIY